MNSILTSEFKIIIMINSQMMMSAIKSKFQL